MVEIAEQGSFQRRTSLLTLHFLPPFFFFSETFCFLASGELKFSFLRDKHINATLRICFPNLSFREKEDFSTLIDFCLGQVFFCTSRMKAAAGSSVRKKVPGAVTASDPTGPAGKSPPSIAVPQQQQTPSGTPPSSAPSSLVKKSRLSVPLSSPIAQTLSASRQAEAPARSGGTPEPPSPLADHRRSRPTSGSSGSLGFDAATPPAALTNSASTTSPPAPASQQSAAAVVAGRRDDSSGVPVAPVAGAARPGTPPPLTVAPLKGSPSKPPQSSTIVRKVRRPERQSAVTVFAPAGAQAASKPLRGAPTSSSSAKQSGVQQHPQLPPCPFPPNVGMHSAAVLHNRFIVVTGGLVPLEANPLKTIGCYDTLTATWLRVSDESVLKELPVPLYAHCSMANGNSLWLIGGLSSNEYAVKSITHLLLEILSVDPAEEAAAAAATAPAATGLTFRIANAAVYRLDHPCAFASCVRLDGTLTPIAIVMCGLSSVRDTEVGAVAATAATARDGGCYECRGLGLTNRCFAVNFDDVTIYRVAQTGQCPTPRMLSSAAALTRSAVSDASSTIVLVGGICHAGCSRVAANAVYVGTVEHNAAYQTFAIRWRSFSQLSPAMLWPERLSGFQLVSCDGFLLVVGTASCKGVGENNSSSSGNTGSASNTGDTVKTAALNTNNSRLKRSTADTTTIVASPPLMWLALLYDASSVTWIEVAPADCIRPPVDSDAALLRQVSSVMGHTCLLLHDASPSSSAAAGSGSSSAPPPVTTTVKSSGVYIVGGVPSTGRRSVDNLFMKFLPVQMERPAKGSVASHFVEYSFTATLELPGESSESAGEVCGIEVSLRGSELSIDALAAQLTLAALPHLSTTSTGAVAKETIQSNLLLYCRDGPSSEQRVPMHRDDLLIKTVERYGLCAIPVIAVLEKPITNFTELIELGRGANGVVYQAMCNDTGKFFAVKHVRCRSPEARARLMREIRLMRILKHKNIVKYLGVVDSANTSSSGKSTSDATALILMEHVSVNSNYATLHEFCMHIELPMRNIQIFTRQVLSAIEYLHSYNVVHQDIKGLNVLMGVDHLKLSDFGTAVQLLSKEDQGSCGVGTPVFMAPEALSGSGSVTTASDIWSLGCLVIEMCSQELPWAGVALSRENLYYRLSSHERPAFPSRPDFPKSGVQFLTACLQHDPSLRPTATELTRHPFITDLIGSNGNPPSYSHGGSAPSVTGAANSSLKTDSDLIITHEKKSCARV